MGSTENDSMETKEDNSDQQTLEEVDDLEWSADQETLLLYSLHGYKPVGANKHFRMLLIQDRLSSAMNKNISAKAIWKKLNTFYDLEALDEAEAEADALVDVKVEFSLPEDEYGEMMDEKVKIKVEKLDNENMKFQRVEDFDSDETDNNEETADIPKSGPTRKENKRDSGKRVAKKRDSNVMKDNLPLKKDNAKDIPKKETPSKKDIKEPKKGMVKEDDKKEYGKKAGQEIKKDIKEEKKVTPTKGNKKELAEKKIVEDTNRDAELKRDQKKVTETLKNQRTETSRPRGEPQKQLRTETPKRAEIKLLKTDQPKRADTPKLQRIEALKKESSAEKKKEAIEKKGERKSPEKTPESARGAKLRTREKKDTEPDKPETATGAKRERSRDSHTEESPSKKAKPAVLPKGRPTRNSIEHQQKTTSAIINTTSPQKRRTRMQ